MKRTILLLLSLIVSMIAMADVITSEQAEEIASQFVNRQYPSAKGKRIMMAAKRQLPVSVAADAMKNRTANDLTVRFAYY